MLSELYRPKTWDEFVGQPAIEDIEEACGDSWLFKGCGERWLFESDGLAGCGKTSAAYVAGRALGCDDFAIERIDSRSASLADFRELADRMSLYGWGGNGRRCFIIDEIHHLTKDCTKMLLGILENLPDHVIAIGTTTSLTWADEVDGLYSRWRKFRFTKLDSQAVADYLTRLARKIGMPFPRGHRVLSYVHHKVHGQSGENNMRELIDGLPDLLRKLKRNGLAAKKSAA
jgi:replication-associated recombination protein RarA